jgi:Tol biopolymer transport system component
VLPTSAIDFSADYLWLPDGRLIYTVNEPGALGQTTTNYWQMRLDASTGEPLEKPRRLTNWAGFRITYSSATTDGKHLAFRKMAGQITAYVADLDLSGGGIANVKHFSLTDSWDFPWEWTPDSRTIIMVSNRTGPYGIYKQSLNEDTAKLLASGLPDPWHVVVSPDGAWVLFIGSTEQGDLSGTAPLMRVPFSGGTPELISRVRNGSFILRARAPSNLCAIAEPAEDRKQMVITAFDPIKGLGPKLTQFATDPTKELQDLSISPDETQLAVIPTPDGPIQILSLRGQARQEIAQNGWKHPETVNWAADGKGLFVSTAMTGGATLLYLDLQGNPRVLWKGLGGGYPVVRVSPDGRHLAFAHWTADSNMWMLENF